jgi:triphosphoribosyl-dephospho-CoA synthase
VASNKPGNVGLYSRQADMTAVDLLLGAAAIAPIMDQAPTQSVGTTILESIRATRQVTRVNTNLGIVLLLAPLASVPLHLDLRGGVMRILMRLTVDDTRQTYEAIRLANPGGLGSVGEQDVAREPTVTLREAMALAADRDMIARQYVNDFEQVFETAELLTQELSDEWNELYSRIVSVFLRQLSKYPDTLIERKFGRAAAEEVSLAARQVIESDPGHLGWAIPAFDTWLRSGCSRPFRFFPGMLPEPILEPRPDARNPGTTADLITAALFVALRRGKIPLPLTRTESQTSGE